MTTQQKRRLLLYGFLLSAVHFTLTGLCKNAPLLLKRPEDMIGSVDAKPYWPPNPLADTLDRLGDILCLPATWLLTQAMPDWFTVVLFVTNSFIWGFTLAALLRFIFARLRFHHEPRVA